MDPNDQENSTTKSTRSRDKRKKRKGNRQERGEVGRRGEEEEMCTGKKNKQTNIQATTTNHTNEQKARSILRCTQQQHKERESPIHQKGCKRMGSNLEWLVDSARCVMLLLCFPSLFCFLAQKRSTQQQQQLKQAIRIDVYICLYT